MIRSALVALVAAATLAGTAGRAAASLTPRDFEPQAASRSVEVLPAGWQLDGTHALLLVRGREVLRLGPDGAHRVEAIAWRINRLALAHGLRTDLITPGRRGDQFVVRLGHDDLLTVTPDLAAAAKDAPAHVTLGLVDRLRSALGGVPVRIAASRGGIPGFSTRTGVASWYGGWFDGRTTADGSRFDHRMLTAAHRSLPLGTLLLVSNVRNGRTTLVRVTDRGPYVGGRMLDLSRAAASDLDMIGSGVAKVRITILKP